MLIRAVFSILRAFALLQGHSWRLPATWGLIALSLALITLDSVRIRPLAFVVRRMEQGTSILISQTLGPMLMILSWEHHAFRKVTPFR